MYSTITVDVELRMLNQYFHSDVTGIQSKNELRGSYCDFEGVPAWYSCVSVLNIGDYFSLPHFSRNCAGLRAQMCYRALFGTLILFTSCHMTCPSSVVRELGRVVTLQT